MMYSRLSKVIKDVRLLVWLEVWKYNIRSFHITFRCVRFCEKCLKSEYLIPRKLKKLVKEGNVTWVNCGCCDKLYCPECYNIQTEEHYW